MDSYESLLKRRAQHQRNLETLRGQAAMFGAAYVPLHLHNQIEAEKAAIEQTEQELAQVEAQLEQDTQALHAAYSDPGGTATRRSVAQLAAVSQAGVTQGAPSNTVLLAIAWLNELYDQLKSWYDGRLEQIYMDLILLRLNDPALDAQMDRMIMAYREIRDNFWEKVYDPSLSHTLHHLSARFDVEFRPLIPASFNANKIRVDFDNTLGMEQEVIYESIRFFDKLLNDLVAMRQALDAGDLAQLKQTQQSAYSCIASFRTQVHASLRQLDEARSALRASLVPIGSSAGAQV